MKPFEVAKDIYWVGTIDWNIRDFHGYSTHQGTTYNAFLVLDDQITLVDTVKKEFADKLVENIAEVVDPQKIDLVISNHTEMDHSGGLVRIMQEVGEDKPLFCSTVGHKSLSQHFPQKWNYRPVKSGDELKIGKRTLSFLETRMLHWPDSMFTYVKEDRILFSSDAFGQHYAGLERFDDEIGENVMLHAKKYFANILLLYSQVVLKLVDKVKEMGLAFDLICPDHGIMWRKDPLKIVQAYVEWSHQRPKRKAVVVYDTMWHSTEIMAEAIVESLAQERVDAKPYHLRRWDRSDIMTEVLDAGAVVVGSPTLNNCLFPTVSDFLCYMKGLKPLNKIGAAFGSYGWSGESIKQIARELEDAKFKLIDPGLKVQYIPDKKALEACRELGKKLAAELPK